MNRHAGATGPTAPIRVLHVMDSLQHGGAEQNLLSMLRRLDSPRFEHHLAWLFPGDHLLEAFRPLVRSLTWLGAHGTSDFVRALPPLVRLLRSLEPQVVHTQLICAQLVTRVAARTLRPRPRVVTTWQNTYYSDEALSEFGGSRAMRSVMRWLDRGTSRFSDAFVAVSEHVATHVGAELALPRERIHVVYNSVEPKRYETVDASTLAQTRAALGLPPDARILLAVGRLVPQKAHADAIAAMGRILRGEPRAVLLIAGDGSMREALRAQIERLGLEAQVRLLGRRTDIPALLQLADLFVFPSRYEGLPVALIEAVANGVPAVVSDIPQNREVAAGLATVRLVSSVEALAQAALDLLAARQGLEPELRTAAERARERFAPERLARALARILEGKGAAEEAEQTRADTSAASSCT